MSYPPLAVCFRVFGFRCFPLSALAVTPAPAMAVSNLSFVLSSWACMCSGFTAMTTNTRDNSRWNNSFSAASAFTPPGGGADGTLSRSGQSGVVWRRAGHHSRPLHRRKSCPCSSSSSSRSRFERAAVTAGGGEEVAAAAAAGGAGAASGNVRAPAAEPASRQRTGGLPSDEDDSDGSADPGSRGENQGEARRAAAGEKAADAAASAVAAAVADASGGGRSSTSKKRLMAQMVKASGQRQHWKEAIVLFDQMQEKGIPTVKAAYGAALRACAKGADWERSTQLLDNYLEEGYELDEAVVNNAVKACCRAGRPREAEAVLAKSLARGLVPEVSLFTAVMNACYTVGDMDGILSLGDQLRAQRLTPDHNAYHLIVTSHISKLDWVSATETLVEMGEAGLAPSSSSARKWRLANAAIEEIDIYVNEEDDYPPRGGREEDEEEGEEGDGSATGEGDRENEDKPDDGGGRWSGDGRGEERCWPRERRQGAAAE